MLTTPGFPSNILRFSCGDIGLKKIACKSSIVAWISDLKVPLLPLGPSCPLQTILLNDLVGCGSPLQILMSLWRTFYNFKHAKQPLYVVCSGLLQPTRQVQILKKVRQMAILICSGLCIQLDRRHSPLRTCHGVFLRADKLSDDITRR
jgi:hypothetical protein